MSDLSAALSTPEIPRRGTGEPCPLSFAQQRLWFLDQLEPGGLYNVAEALRLCGPLDVDALRRALDAVVARHEALRTTFRSVDGEPMQIVGAPAPVACPIVDLSGAEPHEVQRRIDEETGRPFDLSRGPVLRALLLREGEDRHVLVLTIHHIATDGWSVSILFRELAAAYGAIRRGAAPVFSPLRIGYTDFSVWQRRRFSGRALDAELEYWKRELAGAPPVLDLPTDRPRAGVPTWRGATHVAMLPAELVNALRFLGRMERATLFMTLLAAFQTLLHRYSGQEDVLVGSPIANRASVETEDLVGFFANTLVLRARFEGDPGFRELLARVRETALGAFDHQALPFERLVEELRPERSGAHNPLFQTMFALQNAPRDPLRLDGIAASAVDVFPRLAKFDLGLFAFEGPEGIRTAWEYDTALFDSARIERMARHFVRLLGAVVEEPDRPLSAVPLMDDAERRTVLGSWAGDRADYPAVPVTALFEEQAARRPAAPALDFRGGRWTYAELNARANRIAHALRESGVGPGSRVGVALERSPAAIAALIAIGKTGGAYVPLDPEYPEERLAWMCADATLTALVAEALPAGIRLPVVAPHGDREALERRPAHNPPPAGDVDGIACLLYTSGSTGTPKAVAVAHRGIVRLVRGARWADFSDRHAFLHASSLSFDASTFEIWGPLANGGRLVLAEPGTPTLAELEATIRQFGVTTLWLTAGLFHLVVDERLSLLAPIEQLFAGGDVLSPPHVARALARFPHLRLVNGYGPTEGTTFTCCHPVSAADAAAGAIPIGRPIENTRVYVLDRCGRPAPIGVPGELHAGGDGVAIGYWNRPALTAERFVPDPFSEAPGARMFRTGDRAFWREDGRVAFLGRLDAQVKVRGFRVEPAEVERALEEHPDVRQAVVEAPCDAAGERTLVAWLVPREGREIAVEEIRRWALARLPRYLSPSLIVPVASLPLTPQGKVDRRALPAPKADPGEARVSAQDGIELALVRIWEDVLGVRPVSVRDNFFTLGGHSLLAVRMFARVENALGRRLPLATLFQAPTIEQLASAIREEGWSAPWSSLVVIQGGGARPPFFCVPGVGGNVVGFYTLARHLGVDQPVYGLQARGLDGIAEPDTTVEEMAGRYLEQMRAVVPRGPYFLGGASFGGKVAYEMARRLSDEGESVALLALFDTFAPGSRGPAPFASVLRRGLARLFARVDYHLDNLLLQKERGEYIRKKARTVRRRIRSRLWQVAY
ncbi:MAG TPA: amino acid adenylation domain-containing protein, partial [Thermoanaerobaculia bacterium]|nr:amino acid adenylation domain-containing protein [Thermoanaerobaculia bacterium]